MQKKIDFFQNLKQIEHKVSMIILWKTINIEVILNQLKQEGYEVQDEDVARLSPLIHEHINMFGRYSLLHIENWDKDVLG